MIILLKHTSEGTWEIDFNKLNLKGIEYPFYEISKGLNLQLYGEIKSLDEENESTRKIKRYSKED